MTSRVSIEDSRMKFGILTDRAHGVASLDNGNLEMMLHSIKI